MKFNKKKGKEKAHTVREEANSLDEGNDIAFMNSEAAFTSKDYPGVTYILDTGASSNMAPYKNLLKEYKMFDTPKCISAMNKRIFNALGVGMMVLPVHIYSRNTKITLKDTLYVPDIAFTLISIRKCYDAGYKTTF
jgi:hypothetical protein